MRLLLISKADANFVGKVPSTCKMPLFPHFPLHLNSTSPPCIAASCAMPFIMSLCVYASQVQLAILQTGKLSFRRSPFSVPRPGSAIWCLQGGAPGLFWAARGGYSEAVRLLLASKADANYVGHVRAIFIYPSSSPFRHGCCFCSKVRPMPTWPRTRVILQHHHESPHPRSARAQLGWTPLHSAISCSSGTATQVVESLLAAGAAVDARNGVCGVCGRICGVCHGGSALGYSVASLSSLDLCD